MPAQEAPHGGVTHHAYDFAVRLMEDLVVPTFVLDAQQQVIIWNKACERLTGLSAGEVLGTREQWRAFYNHPRPCLADLVVEQRLTDIDDLYASHFDPNKQLFGVRAENWCVMPMLGTERYLAIDAGPIYNQAGQLVAVVETLRDKTDERRATDALERLAASDGLTGLANRRAFDDALADAWRRMLRAGEPLALLMVDVDHFKRYNDHYGHQAGDDCLRRVAAVLAEVAHRAGDVAARYGGEEFALILPGAHAAGALGVAERIRDTLHQLALPHPTHPLGLVTVSVGVVSAVPGPTSQAQRWVTLADAALYQAKERGRDQAMLHENSAELSTR